MRGIYYLETVDDGDSMTAKAATDEEMTISMHALSGTGFGAVLHQDRGSIAFFSRQVAPQHAKLAAYERELIGLVKGVRHWCAYLWTSEFVVRTDHFSLKHLLDQRLSTMPQHTWVSKLFGYSFRVEYKSGRLNAVADALSHRDEDEFQALVHAISRP
jgi:hypothetical protein